MIEELGRIEALWRYPVKSMAGQALTEARLGWHGIDGDRRFALRRLADRGGFPWLSASKLPALVRYQPLAAAGGGLPTHVRTPDRRELEIGGAELREELSRACGGELEMMRLDHGIFDDAVVSVLAVDTVRAIGEAAGRELDLRRFRANVVVRTQRGSAFEEDAWVGRQVRFGDGEDAAIIGVTQRDRRCVMINFDPDTAEPDPRIMQAAVRLHENDAGVYATVIRAGRLTVGQAIYLL